MSVRAYLGLAAWLGVWGWAMSARGEDYTVALFSSDVLTESAASSKAIDELLASLELAPAESPLALPTVASLVSDPTPGDLDQDGDNGFEQLNDFLDDLQALVLALRDPEGYFEMYTMETLKFAKDIGDVHPGGPGFGDGDLDFDDLDYFINNNVPEPNGLGLAAVGAVLTLKLSNRRRPSACSPH